MHKVMFLTASDTLLIFFGDTHLQDLDLAPDLFLLDWLEYLYDTLLVVGHAHALVSQHRKTLSGQLSGGSLQHTFEA